MRTNTHQKLDNRVFSLAANLFGIGENQTREEPKQSIAMETTRPLQLSNRIIAIYPAIIEEAFSDTMDNYRKYIASYNFKTQAENELIELHNSSVKAFCQIWPGPASSSTTTGWPSRRPPAPNCAPSPATRCAISRPGPRRLPAGTWPTSCPSRSWPAPRRCATPAS